MGNLQIRIGKCRHRRVIADKKIANIDTSYKVIDIVDMKDGFYACGYSKAELIKFENLKFEEFVK